MRLYKGGVFQSLIANNTGNDGKKAWVIPADQPLGSDYQVRLVDSSNSNGIWWDGSDADFSIGASPDDCNYTMITPNGGENWNPGDTRVVQWSSTGTDCGATVDLRLYKGGVFQSWIANNTPNDGTKAWAIPANQPSGSDYQVRLVDSSNSNGIWWDGSDADFSIGASPDDCDYTMISPNGGEQWNPGDTKVVQWSRTGTACDATVDLRLYKGGVFQSWIANDTPNDGTKAWLIPADQPLGSDYQVRVVDSGNSNFFDESNADFSIGPPDDCDYTMISPNGGEQWNPGDTRVVQWSSTGTVCGATVDLRLYKGGVYQSLIANNTGNDGKKAWVIPADQPLGSDYQVRVVDSSKPNGVWWDRSDADFSIGAVANTASKTDASLDGDKTTAVSKPAVPIPVNNPVWLLILAGLILLLAAQIPRRKQIVK